MTPQQKVTLLDLIEKLRAFVATLPDTAVPPVVEPPVVEPPVVNPGNVIQLYAMKGEVVGFRFKATSVGPAPTGIVLYEIKTVKTKIPSFKGAPVGDIEDRLQLASKTEVGKNYWADIAIAKTQAAGNLGGSIGGQDFKIKVVNAVMPDRPTMPMYIELQPHMPLRADKLEDNVAIQGPAIKRYADLYRAHRIEPMKQNIVQYPDNVDTWKEFNASYRQLVIDGAIAPPVLFGPNESQAPTKTLLQTLYKAAPDGMIYVSDEGQGTMDAPHLARATQIRKDFPGAKLFATREETPAFAKVIDIFCVVMNWFKRPGHVMTYTKGVALYEACMANGNCQNKSDASQVEPPIGTPMMVLDAPAVHHRAFNNVAYTLGAKFSLYFNGTQKLDQALVDGGLYSEGGNGDGTLVYPGAMPSLRFKYLRMGLNDTEWMNLAKQKGISFSNPVKDAFNWSKDLADYDAVRSQIASKL